MSHLLCRVANNTSIRVDRQYTRFLDADGDQYAAYVLPQSRSSVFAPGTCITTVRPVEPLRLRFEEFFQEPSRPLRPFRAISRFLARLVRLLALLLGSRWRPEQPFKPVA